jgi:hypothetical protein
MGEWHPDGLLFWIFVCVVTAIIQRKRRPSPVLSQNVRERAGSP